MDNIYIHEAVPTWSGFLYQGEIALYLAVKEICKLRNGMIKTEEIAAEYFLEVENFEDIAITKRKKGNVEYLSIHQVKNQSDKEMSKYKIPLVQLMLERGFCKSEGMGDPMTYLHVSRDISSKCNLSEYLTNLKNDVVQFDSDIDKYYRELDTTGNLQQTADNLRNILEKEPTKLNRTMYKNLIKSTEDKTHLDKHSVDDLKTQIQELRSYLDNKMKMKCIDDRVELYSYDGVGCCSGTDIYEKLVNQIKEYKNNDNAITDSQYKYIADKLLSLLRKHIIERHSAAQKGENQKKIISFGEIIDVLDNCLGLYNKEAVIMALRRIYDEELEKYCEMGCLNYKDCKIDKEHSLNKCRLMQCAHTKADLDDEAFVKFCYSLNPDCNKNIDTVECLNKLLNKDGLQESVFKSLREISEHFFIEKADTNIIAINNLNENALLTAISSNNAALVVHDIVKAISEMGEYVSPVFDADELITTRIEQDGSVWENDYTQIQDKYFEIKQEYNNEHNILNPKMPKFVKVETVCNNCK